MNPKESFQVSDELWAKMQPLLPKRVNTHRFGGGRPPAEDRVCLNAILFVLRTGCQWNALNTTEICPSSTAHDRFQECARRTLPTGPIGVPASTIRSKAELAS